MMDSSPFAQPKGFDLSPPPVLHLQEISKQFGTQPVLRNISFSVQRGEIFGYIGANGAGKTTTIKILTGLIKPSQGNAFVCGHSILTDSLHVKARVGYLPESGALFEKLSAREYLTLTGQLHKLPAHQLPDCVQEWLKFFGLSDKADQQMGTFSKGMKQKVCWIAALMHNPDVLILDEPLNGLDVETVARAKDLMKYLVANGKTIFYSSHLIDIVEKVCTRIAVLNAGRLIGIGTIPEIVALSGEPTLEQALLKLWQGQPVHELSGTGSDGFGV